jgi:2-amino-4-hydroxy-6-hydroxymethyldihydropteridine diphosphokinase
MARRARAMCPRWGGSKLPPSKPIFIGSEHNAAGDFEYREGMGRTAWIGLGANLASRAGAPQQTLLAAMDDLQGAGKVVRRSSLYRTEPVGIAGQPAFVNAAAQLETDLEPEALLDFLLMVERGYGRDRSREVPGGPRTLDLDLLLIDDLVVQTARLKIPHPALGERRFVLAPLVEIAREVRHPVIGATMADLLAAVPNEGPNRRNAVRKLADGQPWALYPASMRRTP